MKLIHVVHIFESLLPGGAERQALLLVRRSDPGAFRHTVVNYCQLPGDLTSAFREVGCTVKVLDKRTLGGVRFFLELRRLLVAENPDVVHTWLYSPAFWGRAAAVTACVPGLVASARNGRPYRHWYEAFIDRQLSRFTDARIANAAGVKEVLCRSVGLQEDQVRVIYNGIEAERLIPSAPRSELRERFAWKVGDLVVLAVGRLVVEKDYPLLLRSIARLREEFPQLRLCIAGWGVLEAELLALRASLALEEVVDFLGRREDVCDLLAACDVYVMSSATEGFSNALLEALYAGRAVVSTRVNGAMEILRHEENALLVDVGDEIGLANCLRRILTDSALRKRLALMGPALVRERFTSEAMVQSHERLYAEVADRHGCSH